MALKGKMHGIDWLIENRPLERVPNYSKLSLSVETDYQTTLKSNTNSKNSSIVNIFWF